jgi:hypothetical protein
VQAASRGQAYRDRVLQGRLVAGGLACGCLALAACEGSSDVQPSGAGNDASVTGVVTPAEAGASSSGGSVALPGEDDASFASDTRLAEANSGSDADASEPDSGSVTACATSVAAGTELCDGFESGKLDDAIWKTVTNGPSPSIKVDAVHAHTGTYALHLTVTPGDQSAAQITESVTFPATDDAFYTRIWAYVSPAVAWPANPPDFHTGFIIASGDNDLGHVELAVGANLSPSSAAGPMHYLGYSIYRGPPYDEFGPRSQTVVVNDAWTCIELFESGKGGAAAVRRIWADGTELPEQNDTFDGQAPPRFDLVSIGIWEYHPTPSLSDMWIDDVRVSSQRIGCGS